GGGRQAYAPELFAKVIRSYLQDKDRRFRMQVFRFIQEEIGGDATAHNSISHKEPEKREEGNIAGRDDGDGENYGAG
ncbi:unnamed protein product, partial [Discosporangium mesarthrocarpum]